MPQSLSLILIHVIFSTKDRRPFIDHANRQALHAYMATIARNEGAECYRIGGVEDHVHLAIRLPRTMAVADLIRQIKASSSSWMKEQSKDLAVFAWQRGYACFSISPQYRQELLEYIDNQEEHHRSRTFQEELRVFLSKYEVDYDEAYVWD
ncbi:IS200/IS605 family transposase [bacterium]|nr:IS200/IS605 family transposase [bacterium]